MWPFKKKKKDILVEAIKVLKYEPGDMLVFKLPGYLGSDMESFLERIKSSLPDGVKGMVLEGGTDIEILRKEKDINITMNNSVLGGKQEQRRMMARIAKSVVKEMAPGVIAEDYAKDGITRQIIRNSRP